MIGFMDIAIAGIGCAAGIGIGIKLMSGKVLALQEQVDAKEAPKKICGDCETARILAAREKDLHALHEDFRRLQRSNSQYIGRISRLKAAK